MADEDPDTSPSPLQLATLEELVSELMSRCDAAVLMMRFVPSQVTSSTSYFSRGDMFALIGLADYASHLARMHVQSTIAEMNEDDGQIST